MPETIYGLATLAGKSGVAIIRISGSNSLNIAKKFTSLSSIEPRDIKVANFNAPSNSKLIDKGIILYFNAPHSFTGEDIVEFQVHGSIAVINLILAELSYLKDFCRLAEPGEFSKRAFLNNKIDLTAAEGLAHLIDAETSFQHELAIKQYSGEDYTIYEGWRGKLIMMLSKLEAFVDFPEEDIPLEALLETYSQIKYLYKEMDSYLASSIDGEIISYGINVAIVGAPNVGKSTLLNALAKRDVAIVSNIAGTTRDIVEVRLDLSGYQYILYDTAGIRDSEDEIEVEGIKRSFKALNKANLCILMVDAVDIQNVEYKKIEKYIAENNASCHIIKVANKTDLLNNIDTIKQNFIPVSLKNEAGIEDIMSYLKDFAKREFDFASHRFISNARHRMHIEEALRALNMLSAELPLEISAEYVRMSSNELAKIVGKIDVEEILDEIFSNFCIGK